MGRLFGTDGVRGVANVELTADLAFRLGQAGAYVLAGEKQHTPKILVGKDTRLSCDMLEAALTAGICSVGAEVISLGIIPTPAVAYLTRLYNADAGVVISASHNPFEFNGIKFINSQGYKLSDEIEEKIESIILDGSVKISPCEPDKIGRRTVCDTALTDYVDFAKSTINTDLKGLRILVDCANGASYRTAPETLRQLGAEVRVINDSPDGKNINAGCGSTHMAQIQGIIAEEGKYDIGLAFDGDADRVLAVDENGCLVDGDQIMTIIGLDLKEQNKLKDDTIVVTVMSNMGFDIMARRENINIVKTAVGDRYVLEKMLENGYVLGGEQSGHVILLEHNTTGDGLITALQLLAVLKKTGRKLSELASQMQVLPQVLLNARVTNENKKKIKEDSYIQELCRQIEEEMNGEGRILIRPSGTEPLVRVMLEGKDPDYIADKAAELVRIIEERLS